MRFDWDQKKNLLFNDYLVNFNSKFTSLLLKDIQKVWPTWEITYCWFGMKDILVHLNATSESDQFYRVSKIDYLETTRFERRQDYMKVTLELGKELEFDENKTYDESYFIYRENRYIDFFITIIESDQIKNYAATSYDIVSIGENIFNYIKLENKSMIDPPCLTEDVVLNGIIINKQEKEINSWWSQSKDGIVLMDLIKAHWNGWTINHLEKGLESHLKIINQLENEEIIQLTTAYQDFINKYKK